MSKHTPTPWEVGTHRPYIVARTNPETDTSRDQFYVSSGTPTGGSGWPVISYDEREANAARIVACVNALADRDPARLGDVETALERCTKALEEIAQERGLICFHGDALDAGLSALAAFRTPGAKVEPTQEPTRD